MFCHNGTEILCTYKQYVHLTCIIKPKSHMKNESIEEEKSEPRYKLMWHSFCFRFMMLSVYKYFIAFSVTSRLFALKKGQPNMVNSCTTMYNEPVPRFIFSNESQFSGCFFFGVHPLTFLVMKTKNIFSSVGKLCIL